MRNFFISFLAFAGLFFLIQDVGAQNTEYRLSEPVSHGNLTLFFIHGKSTKGPVPLILAEALEKKSSHCARNR